MSRDDFIAADDRGYLYGDALFETVRVREDGSIRWLDAHIERLQQSGDALGFGDDAVAAAIARLRGLATQKPGIWRVSVSRSGVDAHGQVIPFGGSGSVTLRYRPYRKPVRPRLTIAPGFYLPDDPLAAHKTTSFLRSVEVRRRAMRQGFDDAIMTSRSGLVGEASCANVVVVAQGRAVTPPLRGILPGVTRAGILAQSQAFDRPVEVRDVTADELRMADEIVLLSAGVGVLAAASLQGRGLDNTWALSAQEWLP